MRVWGKKTLLRKDRVKSWGYQNWKPPRWGRVWERRSASEGLLIYRELISFFFNLFFNWRKIALQCSVDFCHTGTQISCNYAYITSLLSLPSLPTTYPSMSSQNSRLGSLCHTVTSHQLSILHMVVYVCRCYFLHSPHSFFPLLCPTGLPW